MSLTRAPGPDAPLAERQQWLDYATKATQTPAQQAAGIRQGEAQKAVDYTQSWLALPEKDRGRMPDQVADTLGENRRAWGSNQQIPRPQPSLEERRLAQQQQQFNATRADNQSAAQGDRQFKEGDRQFKETEAAAKARTERMTRMRDTATQLSKGGGEFGAAGLAPEQITSAVEEAMIAAERIEAETGQAPNDMLLMTKALRRAQASARLTAEIATARSLPPDHPDVRTEVEQRLAAGTL
jgi:hypothetical protein